MPTALMVLFCRRVRRTKETKYDYNREFLQTAQLLIDSGAEVNEWAPHSTYIKFREKTALHEAAMKSQEQYCRLLLKNNSDINCRTSHFLKSRNCLHWACLAPREDESCYINSDSILYYHRGIKSCKSDRSEDYIRFLISMDADVDAQDINGKTPLCLAAECGWLEGVRALIETPSPRKDTDFNQQISMITKAASKWGIFTNMATEIAKFIVQISADPMIDSNKPFSIISLNPRLYTNYWKEHNQKRKTKVTLKGLGHHRKHNGGALSNVCKKRASVANDTALKKFTKKKFNDDWNETHEDGTALGLARKNNHLEIVDYLSRLV